MQEVHEVKKQGVPSDVSQRLARRKGLSAVHMQDMQLLVACHIPAFLQQRDLLRGSALLRRPQTALPDEGIQVSNIPLAPVMRVLTGLWWSKISSEAPYKWLSPAPRLYEVGECHSMDVSLTTSSCPSTSK